MDAFVNNAKGSHRRRINDHGIARFSALRSIFQKVRDELNDLAVTAFNIVSKLIEKPVNS
jgi:hypothetical protein